MITITDLPDVEAQAMALGRPAYEAWAMNRPFPTQPWERLPHGARMVWASVALAAIGAALEFSGVELAPVDMTISGGLH